MDKRLPFSYAEIVQCLKDEIVSHINNGPIISGHLRETSLSCGKENCKCASGKLHGPYLQHGYRAGGKFRNQTVPNERRVEVKQAITKYLWLQQCLEALSIAWRYTLLEEPEPRKGTTSPRRAVEEVLRQMKKI